MQEKLAYPVVLALTLIIAVVAWVALGTSTPNLNRKGPQRVVLPDRAIVSTAGQDVAFLSSTHIILAGWYGGVLVSRDGGKTWHAYHCGAPIVELFVGKADRIWGLNRWHGIHEPSSAAIVYSDDGGESWWRLDLDPSVFMPEEFISARGQEPMIIAADGQVWQHQADGDPSFPWRKVGRPNPNRDGRSGVATSKGLYVATSKNVWFSSDQGTTWNQSPMDEARLCASDTYIWAIDQRMLAVSTPGSRHA